MYRLLSVIEHISRIMARIGGLVLLACAFLIFAEIFLRKLAGYSFQGINEYSGYALAISIAFSLPYALVKKANIRVDAFYNVLPPHIRPLLDWLSIFSLTILAAFLVHAGHDVFADSLRFESTSNTTLSTPLWIPQLIWLCGYIVFFVTAAIFLLTATYLLLTGQFSEITRIVGERTLNEELTEEIDNKNETLKSSKE